MIGRLLRHRKRDAANHGRPGARAPNIGVRMSLKRKCTAFSANTIIFGPDDGRTCRMDRVGRAGLLNDELLSIDNVLPRAAVPVVVAGKPKNSWAQFVQHNIMRVVDLADEMGGIGVVIAASTVERAPHV